VEALSVRARRGARVLLACGVVASACARGQAPDGIAAPTTGVAER